MNEISRAFLAASGETIDTLSSCCLNEITEARKRASTYVRPSVELGITGILLSRGVAHLYISRVAMYASSSLFVFTFFKTRVKAQKKQKKRKSDRNFIVKTMDMRQKLRDLGVVPTRFAR